MEIHLYSKMTIFAIFILCNYHLLDVLRNIAKGLGFPNNLHALKRVEGTEQNCAKYHPALPADQSAEADSCRCKQRLPRRIRSFAAGFADAAAASCTAQLRRHAIFRRQVCSATLQAAAACKGFPQAVRS